MKFCLEKIILWLKNGKVRSLDFLPNKVNVITGDSGTGKTAILGIIDYCFFASKSSLSEEVINENIAWYGLKVNINDKSYLLARKSLLEGKVSSEYYFSSVGEIPTTIEDSNNSETVLKSIFETEFSINRKITFPSGYGSNNLRVGSKISLRYFLMFNTISENIITNGQGVFFDKQNEARYRDALPRIFDIATGIESVSNILKKEKRKELEKNLNFLKKKEGEIERKSEYFSREKSALVKRAKEYSLIESHLSNKESLNALEKVINGFEFETVTDDKRFNLEKKKYEIVRRIKNLERFILEYSQFKKNLKEIEDSLKPIRYLEGFPKSLIKNNSFDLLIEHLSEELAEIKDSRKKKTPVDKQVNDELEKLASALSKVKLELDSLPEKAISFENENEKIFFLGEVNTKLSLFSKSEDSLLGNTGREIESLEDKISKISIEDTEEKRNLTIKLIEEVVKNYMAITENALGNYKNYIPFFDYKDKVLKLKKPKSTYIENVGSSSNHMFLHLFFSLAIHEVSYENSSPFVPPFLVIDQPSRPYYGNNGIRNPTDINSDDYKIAKAFELLDRYIEDRVQDGGEFQIIVFEHIPTSMFSKFKNTRLVDKPFENGNALIPGDLIDSE